MKGWDLNEEEVVGREGETTDGGVCVCGERVREGDGGRFAGAVGEGGRQRGGEGRHAVAKRVREGGRKAPLRGERKEGGGAGAGLGRWEGCQRVVMDGCAGAGGRWGRRRGW